VNDKPLQVQERGRFEPVFAKKSATFNVEGSGQLHDRGQRGAAFAAENLRQVPFREIRLKIEAVKRAVLLDDDLAQPSAEKSLLVCHTARVPNETWPSVCCCKRRGRADSARTDYSAGLWLADIEQRIVGAGKAPPRRITRMATI
jgi:hypothetical protein